MGGSSSTSRNSIDMPYSKALLTGVCETARSQCKILDCANSGRSKLIEQWHERVVSTV